ncbi:MAG TPA: aminotransferase class V-fold PLP-dependent enzyme [Gemmatimonadaceae bacterium]|nr:aminotransferase class V-fold PLP-dependent enzyme [Gemmatimonadaceae bacterium]
MSAQLDRSATALEALEEDMSSASGALFVDLVAAYFSATRDGDGQVSTPRTAGELAARFADALPLDGKPLADIARRLATDVMADANQLMHPMSLGHQVAAPLPAAVWTESLIGALNQSTAIWEMSPTATAIETQLVHALTRLIGWGDEAGGTFTSGGTEATFTALLAARAHAMPDAWEKGVGDDPPVVLCGEHAHYCVTRAVAQLGLGRRSALAVPSRDWKMDVSALADMLDALARAGTNVMAVVATAGSTATGSFDDLTAIGELCQARGIWLHVDGAHGASALLSPAHRHRVRGLAYARSLAWDAHKMMLMPLAAGMLLVRDEADLAQAFSQHAPYLFHGARGERVWDQGTRSFLCSRRADAIKVWVGIQRYGVAGLAALYDVLCDSARSLHESIAARDDFVAMHEPETNILCFRWVGDRSLDDGALDAINLDLRMRYNRAGHGWITTTVLGDRRVLRVTVMNPRTKREHLCAMLDELSREALVLAER